MVTPCNTDSHRAALGRLAVEGADWLVKTQRDDGSWPASIGRRNERPHAGCVAGSAEAARALIAAHARTNKPEYRAAAEEAMRFVNREESFFACGQYLRDVNAGEADGITAEACIHANLDWHAFTGDRAMLEHAGKWGAYALQWVRPRSTESMAEPSFDGLSQSITPRIDVWGGLLIARAFMRLWRVGCDETWREHAWRLFDNIAGLQERDGGFCETWFLDFPSGLESIHIEPTFVTDAFIEFLLDACGDADDAQLTESIVKSLRSDADAPPPLIRSTNQIVEMSTAQPQFIIDGGLRLAPAFDGPYTQAGLLRRAVYTMLRETRLGRHVLKSAPAAKILLNRHRVRPAFERIGRTDFVEITGISQEQSPDGRHSHTYFAPFHEITHSLISTGLDAKSRLAADIEFVVKTLAGDLQIKQVRIDLLGSYEIKSINGKKECIVSSGGNEYSFRITGGAVDSIIRDGNRLAFDVSRSANWNFFGTYSLRLRVLRH